MGRQAVDQARVAGRGTLPLRHVLFPRTTEPVALPPPHSAVALLAALLAHVRDQIVRQGLVQGEVWLCVSHRRPSRRRTLHARAVCLS